MSSDNLGRISKGYRPREPATPVEKTYYLFACLGCAVKLLGMRLRPALFGARAVPHRGPAQPGASSRV
ncbi:MAG: hypothetical protein HYX96_08320 [Chloroflexi bacterium]|nr:hypothetical protein [Chloroflexota bacterium]